eukprot:1370874-Prymnesium_polylepis.1
MARDPIPNMYMYMSGITASGCATGASAATSVSSSRRTSSGWTAWDAALRATRWPTSQTNRLGSGSPRIHYVRIVRFVLHGLASLLLLQEGDDGRERKPEGGGLDFVRILDHIKLSDYE